ncbi:hypothetical protein MTO96_009027 [Rhipicephalus appendiculatus]
MARCCLRRRCRRIARRERRRRVRSVIVTAKTSKLDWRPACSGSRWTTAPTRAETYAPTCARGTTGASSGGRPLVERAAQDVAEAVEASFRDAVGSTSALVAKHSSLRKAAAFYRSCMDAVCEQL